MSVEDVYLKKIAGLRFFQHMSSSSPDAADYQKQNREAFEAIWERANELLTAQGVSHAFLFGSELTTADAFFCTFPLQGGVHFEGYSQGALRDVPTYSLLLGAGSVNRRSKECDWLWQAIRRKDGAKQL